MPISSSRFPPWNLPRKCVDQMSHCQHIKLKMVVTMCTRKDKDTHKDNIVNWLGKEMSDSKLRQGLPRLDETHLGFDETHLGHILVGFKDAGWNLTNTQSYHYIHNISVCSQYLNHHKHYKHSKQMYPITILKPPNTTRSTHNQCVNKLWPTP